ncbi:hypothetical protein BC830DRAFT_77293 [Chytriomyces sp. MP71]|nr:hypothetical protein BC830DRAFT_77293 [Chytriomyces sp. MP71]
MLHHHVLLYVFRNTMMLSKVKVFNGTVSNHATIRSTNAITNVHELVWIEELSSTKFNAHSLDQLQHLGAWRHWPQLAVETHLPEAFGVGLFPLLVGFITDQG